MSYGILDYLEEDKQQRKLDRTANLSFLARACTAYCVVIGTLHAIFLLVGAGDLQVFANYAIVGLVAQTIAFLLNRSWARQALDLYRQDLSRNAELLEMYRREQRPFALYLRGFREESRRSTRLTSSRLSGRSPTDFLAMTRWVEAQIVEELEGRDIEVFGLSNPADEISLSGVIRIAAESDWIEHVRSLSREATLVLLYIQEGTPNLDREIAELRKASLAGKTVGIVGRRAQLSNRSLIDDFPYVISAPLLVFGKPLFQQDAFRRRLKAALDRLEPKEGRSRPNRTPPALP